MDRLKVTDPGGFPIVLDDLAFLQNAYSEAFKGIGSFSDPNLAAANGFILSGCERTTPGGVSTFQPGYIYLQGEVYKVDLHSFTEVPAETEHWTVVETNDPAGNKVFFDTTSHDTYKVRKAKVVTTASPPGDFMPAVADRFHTKILKLAGLNSLNDAWLVDTFIASKLAAASGAWTVPGSSDFIIRYKVIGKTCYYNFKIQNSTLTVDTATIDIGLPAGIIPKTGGHEMNGFAQWQNLNDTPTVDMNRVAISAGINRLVMSKVGAGNIIAVAGTYLVFGEVFFEID